VGEIIARVGWWEERDSRRTLGNGYAPRRRRGWHDIGEEKGREERSGGAA